ncbi:uncharacterized protein LOC142330186 [Lycorma delicatula]|uniref:uncharacterized protein LOC142330186 n=1 Tax=Lycorma delicatula TaxID=130591 RepID=UPI003F511C78
MKNIILIYLCSIFIINDFMLTKANYMTDYRQNNRKNELPLSGDGNYTKYSYKSHRKAKNADSHGNIIGLYNGAIIDRMGDIGGKTFIGDREITLEDTNNAHSNKNNKKVTTDIKTKTTPREESGFFSVNTIIKWYDSLKEMIG